MQWTITGFPQIQELKQYSEIFEIGGYKWWVPHVSHQLPAVPAKVHEQIRVFDLCAEISPACSPNLNRRILIFPKGNKADYLSIYLDVPETELLPFNWQRSATFKLIVVNPVDRSKSFSKGDRCSETWRFRDVQQQHGFPFPFAFVSCASATAQSPLWSYGCLLNPVLI